MLDQTSISIEKKAVTIGYIDAVLEYCEERGIEDYEDTIRNLHPILLEKIKQDFIDKNFFPNKKRKIKLNGFFDD